MFEPLLKTLSCNKSSLLVADIFDYPSQWTENFELVYEWYTIQILPRKYRILAWDAMVSLLVLQGYLPVSCRRRLKGEQEGDIPLTLDKEDIDGLLWSIRRPF